MYTQITRIICVNIVLNSRLLKESSKENTYLSNYTSFHSLNFTHYIREEVRKSNL